MTVHALLVDPPRPGVVLPDLVASSPLSAGEAADLYAAMVSDAMAAAEASGGDLLVNYRPDDLLPGEPLDAEAELRALADDALEDPGEARFEVQVGSTPAARAGNTAGHLLREEGADSVAILEGTAPTLARTDLDGAAMKLRSSEVVLGPAPGGRVHYLGLTEPIDFEGAFAAPALETLAGRAADAGLGADFLPMHPVVERGRDLASVVAAIRARRSAGRAVPGHTAAAAADLGLEVVEDDDGPAVTRSGTDGS